MTPRAASQTGSLFVQQELAIASFLQIPTLVFHFKGIKLEGIAKYLILNPIEVTEVDEVINHIEIQPNAWDKTSKNQLFLFFGHHHTYETGSRIILANDPSQPLSDWYHIIIYNPSSRLHAKGYIAYIKSIMDMNSGQYIIQDDDYKIEVAAQGLVTRSMRG